MYEMRQGKERARMIKSWYEWNNLIWNKGKPFQISCDCGKRNIFSAHRNCIPF